MATDPTPRRPSLEEGRDGVSGGSPDSANTVSRDPLSSPAALNRLRSTNLGATLVSLDEHPRGDTMDVAPAPAEPLLSTEDEAWVAAIAEAEDSDLRGDSSAPSRQAEPVPDQTPSAAATPEVPFETPRVEQADDPAPVRESTPDDTAPPPVAADGAHDSTPPIEKPPYATVPLFNPAIEPRTPRAATSARRRLRRRVIAVALGGAVIALAVLGAYAWRQRTAGTMAASASPTTPAGDRTNAARPQVPSSAPAGPAPATGRLLVGYADARVSVEGANEAARSPVALYELPPGDHQVRIETPGGTVRRTVRITAGQETWLDLSAAGGDPRTSGRSQATTPSIGWVRVAAPVELQLYEGERFLGTSRIGRMLIEAGQHDITLVSDAVGYRETRRVSVNAGATSELRVSLPPGRLSINAIPWANVFVDGQPAGETPLGNVEVASGPHEIRLVHPTFGEVTRTVVVKVGEPTRLSVDLRK